MNKAAAAKKAATKKPAANKIIAAKKDVTHKAAASKPAALLEDASDGDSISSSSFTSEDEVVGNSKCMARCDDCHQDQCDYRTFNGNEDCENNWHRCNDCIVNYLRYQKQYPRCFQSLAALTRTSCCWQLVFYCLFAQDRSRLSMTCTQWSHDPRNISKGMALVGVAK
jgi:hypothetical protein